MSAAFRNTHICLTISVPLYIVQIDILTFEPPNSCTLEMKIGFHSSWKDTERLKASMRADSKSIYIKYF